MAPTTSKPCATQQDAIFRCPQISSSQISPSIRCYNQRLYWGFFTKRTLNSLCLQLIQISLQDIRDSQLTPIILECPSGIISCQLALASLSKEYFLDIPLYHVSNCRLPNGIVNPSYSPASLHYEPLNEVHNAYMSQQYLSSHNTFLLDHPYPLSSNSLSQFGIRHSIHVVDPAGEPNIQGPSRNT